MATKPKYLTDIPNPQHVLIIYAHPDDAEYFAGGLLAKWASEGVRLTLVLVTSGDKGSSDQTITSPQIASIREGEAREAAKTLGIQDVIFLRSKDGEIFPTLELRRHVVRMIRLKQPDAVMSSDPLYRYRRDSRINHPDHYAVAEVVQHAVYPAARDHLNFYELYQDEGLAPHNTRWLYLALPTQPNYKVETTAHRQTQVEALKRHASQIGDPADFEQRMAERYDPELTGEGDIKRYSEFFYVIDLEA